MTDRTQQSARGFSPGVLLGYLIRQRYWFPTFKETIFGRRVDKTDKTFVLVPSGQGPTGLEGRAGCGAGAPAAGWGQGPSGQGRGAPKRAPRPQTRTRLDTD